MFCCFDCIQHHNSEPLHFTLWMTIVSAVLLICVIRIEPPTICEASSFACFRPRDFGFAVFVLFRNPQVPSAPLVDRKVAPQVGASLHQDSGKPAAILSAPKSTKPSKFSKTESQVRSSLLSQDAVFLLFSVDRVGHS